jgi:hypothetical protein
MNVPHPTVPMSINLSNEFPLDYFLLFFFLAEEWKQKISEHIGYLVFEFVC